MDQPSDDLIDHIDAEKRRARLRRQRIELEAELDDETHEALIQAGEGGTY